MANTEHLGHVVRREAEYAHTVNIEAKVYRFTYSVQTRRTQVEPPPLHQTPACSAHGSSKNSHPSSTSPNDCDHKIVREKNMQTASYLPQRLLRYSPRPVEVPTFFKSSLRASAMTLWGASSEHTVLSSRKIWSGSPFDALTSFSWGGGCGDDGMKVVVIVQGAAAVLVVVCGGRQRTIQERAGQVSNTYDTQSPPRTPAAPWPDARAQGLALLTTPEGANLRRVSVSRTSQDMLFSQAKLEASRRRV